MRVLWVKAPLLLRRHPPVLAAVVLSTALAALAASAVPLVRAGVESESLSGQLRSMSALAAGFELRVQEGRIGGDSARRAAATRLGRSVRFLGPPVLSSLIPIQGIQVSGSAAPGFEAVPLARTGAIAHVKHVTPAAGPGVWIADSMAKVTGLRPGGTLRLTIQAFIARPRVVSLPIAGIYHTLEADRDNPYWENWQQDIRSLSPDAPPPAPFVLMSESMLQHVARALFPVVENRFEFPVDPHGLSFADAQRLQHRFRALGKEVVTRSDLGCRPRVCQTSSSLSAALTIAATDVASVTPTISLLSAIGLVIAFGLCVAAGLFLVRRRADEAHVLFIRGEAASVFAARTGLEALLPALVGLGAGLGVALLALRALAPAGTITGETVGAGAGRAAIATAVGLGCIAVGAGLAFPRRTGAHERRRRVSRIPWEIVPLAIAGALLWLVVAGHGVAHDSSGASHPRLAVFLVPVFAVAGAAGLMVRLVRRALARHGGAAAPPEIFFAVRRIAATRGLFVAVIVATATSFGTFAYAATLSSSLDRSVAEKAFVANGSDVQGLVDPLVRLIKPFPFPVALVQIDDSYAAFPSGERVDVIAGDPQALARTLRWGDGWDDDPRRLLTKVAEYDGPGLAAIASPGAPESDAILEQGARIPIHVVGHAPVPGSTAGRPALLVSRSALHRVARKAKILDPPPLATGYLWAKGDPHAILPVLDTSALAPAYLTTLSHIYEDASVGAAKRSYRYVKVIGSAAALLALVALLLYLHARQRAQLIASALVARMGLSRRRDAAALAVEAGGIVLLAGVVGATVATAAASPIAHHVDALPLYAPSPVLIVPWMTLVLGLAVAVAAGALLGALAVAIAARSDVAEALRVA